MRIDNQGMFRSAMRGDSISKRQINAQANIARIRWRYRMPGESERNPSIGVLYGWSGLRIARCGYGGTERDRVPERGHQESFVHDEVFIPLLVQQGIKAGALGIALYDFSGRFLLSRRSINRASSQFSAIKPNYYIKSRQ